MLISLVFCLASCSVQQHLPQEQRTEIAKDTLGNQIIIISPQEQSKAVDGETIRTIAAELFGTLVTIFTILNTK